jgi:predicted nucleotidyltransferase/DNA-binding XRE family transcriptional regulator
VPLWYNAAEVIKMTLKQLRKEKGLTQTACAEYLQIPLRTYKRYEADESKINRIKYQYIINRLAEFGIIDEEHGKLTLDQIKSICSIVFRSYPVEYCYLFGSYAKGKETEQSDVDLLISMPLNGLQFFEILELLREKLKKKVDLLDISQLNNNTALVQEILKDGIKIYG